MKRLPAKTGPFNKNGGVSRRGGTIGNRGGTGRPSDAFRIRAQMIAERAKILEVAGHIASGDILEMLKAEGDTMIFGPTKNRDRLAACEYLSRVAHNLPASGVQVASFGPLEIVVVAE